MTGAHSLGLLIVIVQQLGTVQIQRVTSRPARQTIHAPLPQRPKGSQIAARTVESPKKSTQGRLTADGLNLQQARNRRIPSQKCHLSQFFGPAEDAY